MKRLLAYLFLVLGLGLVFSVNAFAWTGKCVKLKDDGKWPFYVEKNWGFGCPDGMKKVNWSEEKFKEFKKKIDEKYLAKKELIIYDQYEFCSNYVNATRYFIEKKGKKSSYNSCEKKY